MRPLLHDEVMNVHTIRLLVFAFLFISCASAVDAAEAMRIREGDRVELEGEFRRMGDRITFATTNREGSDQSGLRVLENLALQRVAAVLKIRGGRLHWKVVGEMTEFQGENFLFIRHAIIVPKD